MVISETPMIWIYGLLQVSALDKEDFTGQFVGTIGTEGDKIDIITIVHRSLSYEMQNAKNKLLKLNPVYF